MRGEILVEWIYKTISSKAPGVFELELRECVEQLELLSKAVSLSTPIVRLNIFIGSESCNEFFEKKDTIEKFLAAFEPFHFINEIIPQKAFDRQIAFKAMCFQPVGREFTVQTENNGSCKFIEIALEDYSLFLTSTSSFVGKTNIDSSLCLQSTHKTLKNRKLELGDVVRQWNFIGGILDEQNQDDNLVQTYQEFNDVRSLYYKKGNFKHGFPSATGIGMDIPGIILQTISVSENPGIKIIPINNPLQKPAHKYSDKELVGISDERTKTTPKFERAKAVLSDNGLWLFVSGTAAIEGEASLENSNVEAQAVFTIDLISKLASKENLLAHGIDLQNKNLVPETFRAYIKHESDYNMVRNVCNSFFGNIPGLVLVADICRKDLLLEIECEYSVH